MTTDSSVSSPVLDALNKNVVKGAARSAAGHAASDSAVQTTAATRNEESGDPDEQTLHVASLTSGGWRIGDSPTVSTADDHNSGFIGQDEVTPLGTTDNMGHAAGDQAKSGEMTGDNSPHTTESSMTASTAAYDNPKDIGQDTKTSMRTTGNTSHNVGDTAASAEVTSAGLSHADESSLTASTAASDPSDHSDHTDWDTNSSVGTPYDTSHGTTSAEAARYDLPPVSDSSFTTSAQQSQPVSRRTKGRQWSSTTTHGVTATQYQMAETPEVTDMVTKTDSSSVSPEKAATSRVHDNVVNSTTASEVVTASHASDILTSWHPTMDAWSNSSSGYRHTNVSATTIHTTTTESSPSRQIIFQDFVRLMRENLTQCFQEGESLALNAVSGMISFSREGGNGTGFEDCTIVLTAPPEMQLEINYVLNISTCYDLQLYISVEGSIVGQYYDCTIKKADIVTGGNIVEVRIVYRKLLRAPVELVLNFTASAPPHLEVHFTSATAGEGVKKKKSIPPPHPPKKSYISMLPIIAGFANFSFISECHACVVLHADI